VSGIWRVAPPGRQWVPGYWAKAGEGAQWISGYWGDAEHSDVTYLPEPPATLEVGPSGEAPSANHTWLPGNWIWSQTRYAWRSGYWTVGQANWDWIPAHYSWTPSGYVFVDGYYDYSADRRGVLYAPVYFDPTVYNRRDYVYSPTTIINPAVFTNHLFLRPRYGHYYFGDYYGTNYTTRGYSPWFSFSANRQGYDPFYAQQRWQNRLNSTWETTIHSNYANFRDQEFSRPPRTWAEQQQRQLQAKTTPHSGPNIAESYSDFVKNKENSYRFQQTEKTERQQYQERERAIRQLSEQRLKSEAEAANRIAKPEPNRDATRPRITFPNSPIRGLPIDQLDKTHAPPSRHETPKPDMKIEPKPRKASGPSK
jgi:WXXGXW repeat (2 copies)